jgi:signal transduction histidine kinase
LLTMVERAEAVGGHCWITSQPGQGTQVTVEAPR